MTTYAPMKDGHREKEFHDLGFDADIEWRSPSELVVTIDPPKWDEFVGMAREVLDIDEAIQYTKHDLDRAEDAGHQEGYDEGKTETVEFFEALAAAEGAA